MHIFPGKKSLIAFLGAIVVLSIIIFQKYDTPNSILSFNRTAEEPNPILEDVDGDGLIAWEEKVWGTDPNNPDTDGDGTPDQAEILEHRDPTAPGPDDSLVESYITSETASFGEGSIKLSLTEQIVSQISDNTFEFYTNDGSEGFEPKEQLSEQLETAIAPTVLSDNFSVLDIVTVAETPESLAAYGNSIIALIDTYGSQTSDSDLVIIADALSKSNPKELERLLPIIALQDKVVEELLITPVPEGLSTDHLSLTNTLWKISQHLRAVAALFEDPVLGLLSFQNYLRDWEAITGMLDTIAIYIKSHGVVFNEETQDYSPASN